MNSDRPTQFEKDIQAVINRHSQENASNTPDFILAAYLADCLAAFNQASTWRETLVRKGLPIGGIKDPSASPEPPPSEPPTLSGTPRVCKKCGSHLVVIQRGCCNTIAYCKVCIYYEPGQARDPDAACRAFNAQISSPAPQADANGRSAAGNPVPGNHDESASPGPKKATSL